MNNKLYIGGLSSNCTSQQIKTLFENYGKVLKVKILANGISPKKNINAYVYMSSAESAKLAIRQLHNKEAKEFANKRISVTPARGIISRVLYGYYNYYFSILINPIHFFMTLWKARILFYKGTNWSSYPHFSSNGAFIAPFYWVRALNFKLFGRNGISPFMGIGKHHLSKHWFYTQLSLNSYWKAGAVTLLLSMLTWWLSHFLWYIYYPVDTLWFSIILVMSLISTSFYRQAFICQNYNIMGWMFLPAVLFSWFTSHWLLALLLLLAASFFSFTLIFILVICSIAYSLQLNSLYPLLTIIPATIKLLFHLYPMLEKDTFKNNIFELAKAIGFMAKKSTKYKRKNNLNKQSINLYLKWLLIYIQFIIIYFITNELLPPLLIAALIIWLLNSTIFRFADEQSMEILIFSIATSSMYIVQSQNIILLISYWLLASPFFLKTSILSPINISSLLTELTSFFSNIQKGKKIILMFSDPNDDYHKLFDGQRMLLDYPKYVTTLKNVNLIPDFSSVFEFNYKGAPDFWGVQVNDVKKQMKYWKADYCIVHQLSNTSLEKKWESAGFKQIGHLSWRKYGLKFNLKINSKNYPEWFLLKPINNQPL